MGYITDENGKKVYAFEWWQVYIAIFVFVILLTCVITAIVPKEWLSEKSDSSVAAKDYGYYPGRQSGDYDDLVFDFDAYLNDKGATNVQRYVYRESESSIITELQFDLKGDHYRVKSTDLCGYVMTSLTVTHKGKEYTIEDPGLGRHTYDANSPLWMNSITFDALHVITDDNADFYYGGCEGDCPFRNLGIAHWSYNDNGRVDWHEDYNTERFDLHY